MNCILSQNLSECSCHGNPSPFRFPVQDSDQRYPFFEQSIPCPYSDAVIGLSFNPFEIKHTFIKAGETHA